MASLTLKRRKLEIKPSPIHGYGVFACETIQAGEIIEECYYLRVPHVEAAGVNNYVFASRDEAYDVLPLGYGHIYNHSSNNNAAACDSDDERDLFVVKAKRLIKPGEEIFVNYGQEWFAYRKIISYEYIPVTSKRRLISLLRLLVRFGIISACVFGLIWLKKKV